jgi:hypothetical protein
MMTLRALCTAPPGHETGLSVASGRVRRVYHLRHLHPSSSRIGTTVTVTDPVSCFVALDFQVCSLKLYYSRRHRYTRTHHERRARRPLRRPYHGVGLLKEQAPPRKLPTRSSGFQCTCQLQAARWAVCLEPWQQSRSILALCGRGRGFWPRFLVTWGLGTRGLPVVDPGPSGRKPRTGILPVASWHGLGVTPDGPSWHMAPAALAERPPLKARQTTSRGPRRQNSGKRTNCCHSVSWQSPVARRRDSGATPRPTSPKHRCHTAECRDQIKHQLPKPTGAPAPRPPRPQTRLRLGCLIGYRRIFRQELASVLSAQRAKEPVVAKAHTSSAAASGGCKL